MSFRNDFPYMPPGSYAVLPDGSAYFRKELPEELKERFLKDLAEKQKREHENWDPYGFR